MRVEKLDELIVSELNSNLLTESRLSVMLEGLLQCRAIQSDVISERQTALEKQIATNKERLTRLYRAIEEVVVDVDEDLKTGIQALKTERDLTQTTFDRLVAQGRPRVELTPDRLSAFASLMRSKLAEGDAHAKMDYIRAVVSRIEVGDESIRIIGEKSAVADAIMAQEKPDQKGSQFCTQMALLRGLEPCIPSERPIPIMTLNFVLYSLISRNCHANRLFEN